MSQLLSHVPFPVRSSRSPMSPSLMRLPSHVLSQLPTRFTPSKRSLRPLTSTTPQLRLTLPMLLQLPLMPDMLLPDMLLLDTLLVPDMLLLPSELPDMLLLPSELLMLPSGN